MACVSNCLLCAIQNTTWSPPLDSSGFWCVKAVAEVFKGTIDFADGLCGAQNGSMIASAENSFFRAYWQNRGQDFGAIAAC
ncbi:MAG: hypothetical protein AB8B71_08810 [Paracoccaceae bacterium]